METRGVYELLIELTHHCDCVSIYKSVYWVWRNTAFWWRELWCEEPTKDEEPTKEKSKRIDESGIRTHALTDCRCLRNTTITLRQLFRPLTHLAVSYMSPGGGMNSTRIFTQIRSFFGHYMWLLSFISIHHHTRHYLCRLQRIHRKNTRAIMSGFVLGTGSGVLTAAAVYYTLSAHLTQTTASLRSE